MRINASDLWRIEKCKDLSKEGQFTYLPGVNWPKLQKNQKTGNCRIISDVKEERGAALTCREGDEENIQFWVLGHRLDVQCSWTISSRTDGTDAFDTLYIGCEKFPQEVISNTNYNGFGWFLVHYSPQKVQKMAISAKKWKFFAFFLKLSKVIGHLFCNFAPDLADGDFLSRIVRACSSPRKPDPARNRMKLQKKSGRLEEE